MRTETSKSKTWTIYKVSVPSEATLQGKVQGSLSLWVFQVQISPFTYESCSYIKVSANNGSHQGCSTAVMITHSCKYARTTGSVEFAFDPICKTYWARQRWWVSLVQIRSGFKKSWEVLPFNGSKLAIWIYQNLLIRFKHPLRFTTF